MDITLPTIHMNGTGRKSLQEGYGAAADTPDRLALIKQLAKKKKRETPAKQKAKNYAAGIIRQVERISKLPCDYVIR